MEMVWHHSKIVHLGLSFVTAVAHTQLTIELKTVKRHHHPAIDDFAEEVPSLMTHTTVTMKMVSPS